jgi:signal transduction histidine kinase
MKKSLRAKYQLLLLIFFIVIIAESAVILVVFHTPMSLEQLKGSIQSLIILFIVIKFVLFVGLFYYIPYQYEHALKEIHRIIHEISEGKYQIDLEQKTLNQNLEIKDLMIAMQKMMSIIIRFDALKTDKIYEHHQRLQALINMMPQGCMIVSVIGEIVYINGTMMKAFPALVENLNIFETLLPDSVENEFKPILIDCIRSGRNLHSLPLKIKSSDNVLTISSSIVRNKKGLTTGAIFILVKP